MVLKKKVVHNRVASVTGVPMAKPKLKTTPSTPLYTPPVPGIETPPSTQSLPERQLPEVKNIRTTELRGDFARVEWDVVRMPGLAYKVWLDGVAMGVAVTEPRKEFLGLRPGKRYKVEIRTQPHSKMSRQGPSKKVTYRFTTPREIPSISGILKTIKIRRESIGHKGTIYKAETNLGVNVSQFKYEVWQTIGRLTERIEVEGVETTNYGGFSFNIPYSVRTPLDRRIAIKWGEQEIAGQRYKAGWTEGVVILRPVTGGIPPVGTPVRPPIPPVPSGPPIPPLPAKGWYFDDDMLRCKELGTEPISRSAHSFANRSECQAALAKHIRDTRKLARVERVKERKRKLSARVEELMKKRSFPKAVREAIEKGLERKDAPRNIERIIEKVAKTNEPNYILRRTIAKRIARGGVVQYKVDTDKGTIIYENADETDSNAILGMSTPLGEVIPLQIKVIR